jgi:hypothetical protein
MGNTNQKQAGGVFVSRRDFIRQTAMLTSFAVL